MRNGQRLKRKRRKNKRKIQEKDLAWGRLCVGKENRNNGE